MSLFIYDNSFEGLITSIYYAFYSKSEVSGIYGINEFNAPLLLDEIINVNTDISKFKKVRDSIITKIDLLCLKKIYITYLSNYPDKGLLIFKYLKYAFKLGKNTHIFLHIDAIRKIDEINRKVSFEKHRFEGFIRFKSIHNEFLYSAFEPDNDILELLAEHFINRFSNECFIIHDISRNKALIYNTSSYEIIELSAEDCSKIIDHKDEYSLLWKTYFKSTTIEERKNSRLQNQMMPKRYWKHILETED